MNARKSEVLQGGGLKPLEWKSIIVGDIIRVQNNSEIPADLLFLSSSDPQGCALFTFILHIIFILIKAPSCQHPQG